MNIIRANVSFCQGYAQEFVRYLAKFNKKYIFKAKKLPKKYIDILILCTIKTEVLLWQNV